MQAPLVHLVEPTGFGGIFQHTCAVAGLLAGAGRDVTLHTARQHEQIHLPGVNVCRCVWWPRNRSHHRLRMVWIAASMVVKTLPHLHRAAGRGSVVHVEGAAASGALTVLTLGVAGRRGRAVVYSPHNTFSRRGRVDELVLRSCLLAAGSTVAYSRADVVTLRGRGAHAELAPLVVLVPDPDERRVVRWRETWGAGSGDEVVLFAGLVRRHKRLDVLVRAARGWPTHRRLAVVGEDRGELEGCRALAAGLGVDLLVHNEFVGLDEFVAAVRAADVVVAPYERASQSAVLAVARALGTPTIAADVGGLAELADRTFPPGDHAALAAAIEATFVARSDGRRPRPLDGELALAAHEAAYRHAARRRGPGVDRMLRRPRWPG